MVRILISNMNKKDKFTYDVSPHGVEAGLSRCGRMRNLWRHTIWRQASVVG
jgi:hypothetical protein